MSLPTSRPKVMPSALTTYSRPSTRETRRPPVAVVGFLGAPADLPCPMSAATSAALTNCVLPPFWSSPTRSSCPAISIRSPCNRGLGSTPSWTPLTNTIASGVPRRITTPAGPTFTTARTLGLPSGNCTSAPSKAPMVASPSGRASCWSRSCRYGIRRGNYRGSGGSASAAHLVSRGGGKLPHLQSVESCIQSVGRQQRSVGPPLADFAVMQHQNLRRARDG